MAYCHGREVVHRDLKLSNILVNLDTCEVRICDFGLSRVLKEPNVPRCTTNCDHKAATPSTGRPFIISRSSSSLSDTSAYSSAGGSNEDDLETVDLGSVNEEEEVSSQVLCERANSVDGNFVEAFSTGQVDGDLHHFDNHADHDIFDDSDCDSENDDDGDDDGSTSDDQTVYVVTRWYRPPEVSLECMPNPLIKLQGSC